MCIFRVFDLAAECTQDILNTANEFNANTEGQRFKGKTYAYVIAHNTLSVVWCLYQSVRNCDSKLGFELELHLNSLVSIYICGCDWRSICKIFLIIFKYYRFAAGAIIFYHSIPLGVSPSFYYQAVVAKSAIIIANSETCQSIRQCMHIDWSEILSWNLY